MPPPPVFPGDEEILEAVQALQSGGSPDAFEVIFRKFYQPLFRLFANRPGFREEADDLAQETLARAFDRIDRYTPTEGASFAGWLRTIAENLWKNAVRERNALKRALSGARVELPAESSGNEKDVPQDARPDPQESVLAHERTQVLREALASLPPGMRQCTELRLFQDLQYQEIAAVTGIGLNSVRSQLFEARKRLKPVLEHYFQGADL
jgi:RNA polymerase sigma-70 factor, ECF subfamily